MYIFNIATSAACVANVNKLVTTVIDTWLSDGVVMMYYWRPNDVTWHPTAASFATVWLYVYWLYVYHIIKSIIKLAKLNTETIKFSCCYCCSRTKCYADRVQQ